MSNLIALPAPPTPVARPCPSWCADHWVNVDELDPAAFAHVHDAAAARLECRVGTRVVEVSVALDRWDFAGGVGEPSVRVWASPHGDPPELDDGMSLESAERLARLLLESVARARREAGAR